MPLSPSIAPAMEIRKRDSGITGGREKIRLELRENHGPGTSAYGLNIRIIT